MIDGEMNDRKKISRRNFLIGAAGLAGSAFLVACGDNTATSAPAATTAAATTAAATTAAATTAAATTAAATTAAATTAAATTAAATTASATTAASGSTGGKMTIALVQGVKGDPFYVTMEKGARAKAQELGVDLIVDGPAQFDAVLQTPIVDALIARGINALIIAACDKQAMIAPLKRANDAGIKVISVDTFIGDGDYEKGPVTFPLSYIGSDNVQGGKIAGDALIKAIGGKGKLYIQNVKPGISTTDQREQGCKDAINASGGAVTLAGVDYNGDSAAKAAEQTAAVLQRTPDLAGIFGCNLFSAEGAAQAVKNVNKTGAIKIANFDAPEQAIKDLRDGVVDLVIAQKPSEMGSTAVDYAVKALKGDTSSLKKRVPTGYVVIDKTNVDTPEAQNAIYKSS
ncbi:MAG TPA: ABC transporter substrate-binding protein [Chloroflexia bacterium]|nr:ABC transporter substrate-binding protein [Chloroflexia bacterium]